MIKNIILLILALLIPVQVFAKTEQNVTDEKILLNQSIQSRVNDIGAKLLNANRIEQRIVFVYDENGKDSLLKIDKSVTSREIVLYGSEYQFIQNDDELAAYLSRGILAAMKSYHGFFKGYLSALQLKAAPKKFEVVADKRAVDFMVAAGYNPIGLITFIQKSCPQKRYDTISTKNLTSKRLAIIYEYIYTKYPYFLSNNSYLENEHYQNFLLTSQENRKMLYEKIKSGKKGTLHYE